jgi:hypothetical protein
MISIGILVLIIRLIQSGKLDISYCWIWMGVGLIAPFIVVNYAFLLEISRLIGAVTVTTTLFLFSTLVLFLLCLQFSFVISVQRRQIKKISQQMALLTYKKNMIPKE